MLAVFMDLKDVVGKPMFSDILLRDVCVSFLLGGTDGTTVVLSWFLWLIDRNPNIEEMNNKMKYLQAALSEVLRLYPSIPMDQKEEKKSAWIRWLHSYVVKNNTWWNIEIKCSYPWPVKKLIHVDQAHCFYMLFLG